MTETALHVCRTCARYSLLAECPNCGAPTRSPHPPRFDATDRYGVYRRRLLAAVSAERTGA